jgi:L-ribulokinase
MGGVKRTVFKPNTARHKIYLELYALYRELHDAFGTKSWSGGLFNVMKDLLALKDRQRR